MTTTDWLTIGALLIGPVLAVAVQLRAEVRKQERERKLTTFRMLVSTRHIPADPTYSVAINMIPIDFNRVKSVIEAHKSYIATNPTPENVASQDNQIMEKQTKLIFEIAKHLGYQLSEADIQTTAYAAGGFVQRDNLMLRAWDAWPRIADALEAQIKLIAGPGPDAGKSENGK